MILPVSMMSALGRKRTFAPQKVMSALPPKADIRPLNIIKSNVDSAPVLLPA
jgi:hypothetical protein